MKRTTEQLVRAGMAMVIGTIVGGAYYLATGDYGISVASTMMVTAIFGAMLIRF